MPNASPNLPPSIEIGLSPYGKLYPIHSSEPPSAWIELQTELDLAFQKGPAYGLLHLALTPIEASESQEVSPSLLYWKQFGSLYLRSLFSNPTVSEATHFGSKTHATSYSIPPPIKELEEFCVSAPPMVGAEYIQLELLTVLWKNLEIALFQEVDQETKGDLKVYLKNHKSQWSLLGRVCFHLAENKQSAETPFAFLATYTHRITQQGRSQHLPLNKALEEYAGSKNKSALLSLLEPIDKASQQSPFLKQLVDSQDIFHPLMWTPREAYDFLKEIPKFEAAGMIVRVPNWWKAQRPPRPQITIQVGKKAPSHFSADSLLDFSIDLTLEGEQLTSKEWEQILSSTEGLAFIRGQWVEVDKDKLTHVLNHWEKAQNAAKQGLTFSEAMRTLSGASLAPGSTINEDVQDPQWCTVMAGDWLSQTLTQLREPERLSKEIHYLKSDLKASLRSYQEKGVAWLWLLHQIKLGGCLADDMGLGKTIQVIALLLLIKREKINKPSLLIIPASLIGNWKSEIERFAPTLTFSILHASQQKEIQPQAFPPDLMITTYSMIYRDETILDAQWNLVVLDEAQAIKNPNSKQTKAVKSLKSNHRLALTGTPIENHLSDLWSLFDFICPGLLGSAKTFSNFTKSKAKTNPTALYSSLRKLVTPYILRRLKTDKTVISDLPDKTEIKAFCSLTKTQAALYQTAVEDLTCQLKGTDGIKRKGVILAFLMGFKQICNHPSQWLKDGQFDPKKSGKFSRLKEICEVIFEKQEKVLIFTQFREMTDPLNDFLKTLFGQSGLVLHGGTPIKERKKRVDLFQSQEGPPYFILSLKAGGTGLNLTSASHVIHFDRWWNPAVENQATDRAFRIGQRKNVLVHKFICRGTIEDKIDLLIESKKALSSEILEESQASLLTELSNDDLLKLVKLDIGLAMDSSSSSEEESG